MPLNITKEEVENSLILAKELHASSTEPNLFTKRMGPIVDAPESKNFLIKLMDVAFRSNSHKRVSDYVLNLIRKSDFKGLFTGFEQALVNLFNLVGHFFPKISVPLMLQQIKSVTGPVVFFVEGSKFKKHTAQRKSENINLNVNLIGEALTGEEEAAERIEEYKTLLNREEIDYISIKVSTIFSQIFTLAYNETVSKITSKLSILYKEVLDIEKRTGAVKFINLDMEEYRDLPVTVDTFINTLSLPQFKNLRAGIVLQAYLPDSYIYLLQLKEFAKKRVEEGGAPIKIRVVKGANLEMEKTESSLEDWGLVTFSSKLEADANFKKLLFELLEPDVAQYVNVGVASHNIFDLAITINKVKREKVEDYVDFEMLEGMADALVRKIVDKKVNVLLYTPIVNASEYNSAIAYLVRRLDEGTQEGNFLKEGIGLEVESQKWLALEADFKNSIELIPHLDNSPRRKENRLNEVYEMQGMFSNVANTDWVLPENREWISAIKEDWKEPLKFTGKVVPTIFENKTDKKRAVISQTAWSGELPWQYELADNEDYSSFINNTSDWYDKSVDERAMMLRLAAVEIAKQRGNLIGIAVIELGKTITEVDVEVSEAIDFANFYAESILDYKKNYQIEGKSKGINLILSPWNFPVAIPIGGVLASLAAGKRVILKPSTNAAATAYLTCKCLWDAGIPKSAVAFMPAKESDLDPFLGQGIVFDAVILTGGTATAQFLLDRNPELPLYAETGGKNATIVTALSDRDQAIKNVVQSAFGNTGQKCSATSLLVLEKEVFSDNHFKALLVDATLSKAYGNPWDFETQIGPLAVPISDKLQAVIDNTNDSEWLLKPTLKGNFFLSPGIKWGVTTEDFEYNNELFGPILSVMCANDLEHAIKIVNGVPYGLTSGIESLSKDEVIHWQDSIKAGNLYANRSTTGAIVLRQPFGGMKASCFGFGMKAGGRNYVLQFLDVVQSTENILDWQVDYEAEWNKHFSQEIDYLQLRGQHNINRYLTPEKIWLICDETSSMEDMTKIEFCANLMNSQITKVSTEELSELISEINHNLAIRNISKKELPESFIKACHEKAVHIYSRPVSAVGRVELLNYLTEQNFSYNYHRYGNLLGEQPKD